MFTKRLLENSQKMRNLIRSIKPLKNSNKDSLLFFIQLFYTEPFKGNTQKLIGCEIATRLKKDQLFENS